MSDLYIADKTWKYFLQTILTLAVGARVGGVGVGSGAGFSGSIQTSFAYTSVKPPSPEHPATASYPLRCLQIRVPAQSASVYGDKKLES